MTNREIIEINKKSIQLFKKWKRENRFPHDELDKMISVRESNIKELEAQVEV